MAARGALAHRDLRRDYAAEVASTDRAVGRVLDALHALPGGAEVRTIVVLTADHGESLGEHDTVGHARDLTEPGVRVPFMIRVLGVDPRVVARARSTLSLTPTLLDTLCEHVAGNYRVLLAMAAELLDAAVAKEQTTLDEKLYLEVFAPPAARRTTAPTAKAARR